MSKETFTREKPHLNIATIGGGAVLLTLIVIGALALFNPSSAPPADPTNTATSAQSAAQGTSTDSPLSLAGLQANWVLYQDLCGGSFTTLQTSFTLRNDGTEPVPLPNDTLLVTFFGPPDPDSEDGAPQFIEIFINPHFLSSNPQFETDSLPAGGQLKVFLELSHAHPDFLWTPTHNPAPANANAATGYTFYGRYVGAASPASSSDIPAATLLLPYFPVSSSSSAPTGGQLWGDYFYVDVDSSSAFGGANQLWGDYQYLDVSESNSVDPSAGGPFGSQDTYVTLMMMPDVPGLFKDTADGETASASNIVLKRGYTADLDMAGDDSGEFWFFDPNNWETINRAIEEDHSGAYHFLLEVAGGGEDVPVIIGSLPNVEDDQKRPPMVLFYWGSKFPQSNNQSDLVFIQKLSQQIGWATVSGLSADIQVVEFTHPTPCPTSTPSLSSGGDSPTTTDTPQPNGDPQTPTSTLSLIIQTPKPEKTKPTPTSTLEPSRTPRPSKPSPTPTKSKD